MDNYKELCKEWKKRVSDARDVVIERLRQSGEDEATLNYIITERERERTENNRALKLKDLRSKEISSQNKARRDYFNSLKEDEDDFYYQMLKIEMDSNDKSMKRFIDGLKLEEKQILEDPDYYRNEREKFETIKAYMHKYGADECTYQILPSDNADRLIHYNLEDFSRVIEKENKGADTITDFSNITDINKYYDEVLKETIPKSLVIGTDVSATLAMGFPIPYMIEYYIINAKEYHITGEDLDAETLSTSVTEYNKQQYDGGRAGACDYGGHDDILKHSKGKNSYADAILKEYYDNTDEESRLKWRSQNINNSAMKQLAKALINGSSVLTTQFYKSFYENMHEIFAEGDLPLLPHRGDLIKYYKHMPKHKSKEHLDQIERILSHLEKHRIIFLDEKRLNYFPLNKDQIEDYVSIEEYCKRYKG